MYNGINGGIGRTRGHYDPLNSVLAGGLTGAIFKSTGKGTGVQTFSQGSNATPGLGQLRDNLLMPSVLYSLGMIAGLRAAGSAGGVCAVAAGIWAYGKKALNL